MNAEEIAKVLIEHDYTEKEASTTAGELAELSDCLKSLLVLWMDKEEETDYSAEGFTLLGLKQMFGMTYPAALLTMDWLIKEPSVAVMAVISGIK